MRLGLVIYGSLDTLSGGYLYDRKLVEYLRGQGDMVEIVALPWRNYARHLGDNFSLLLTRLLTTRRYAVLLQDELNHPSLFYLNHRLRGQVRYPIVSIVHHLRSSEARPAWQNGLYRQVERRYLESVDGFIFNSETTRQAVYAVGRGLTDRPYVVAYPAGDRFPATLTDADIWARAGQPGPLRLVFVGNWIPRKGLLTLLEAVARLPDGTCTLAVVGSSEADPDYARRVRQLVTRLNLAGRVELCGRLSDTALATILRAAHVLAVPSTYEGFGIVYLEGMAFGLPALATNLGAAAEVIDDGMTGLIVPPFDAAALAAAIQRLAADRGRLAQLGQAARRRYDARSTWEATTAQIRAFLERIAL